MSQPSKVPISKRLVLINSISGIATRVLTVGVFAWVIQYLMKQIPEEEFAIFALVTYLAMMLPLLQTALSGGLSRFVTAAYARHDLAEITRIVSSQFPLLVGGAIVLLLVGGLVSWNIHHLFNISPGLVGKARLMMFLIVGRMAIGMCLAPFNSGLHANQRFVLQNVIDIGASLLRMSLMLGFVLGIGPNVVWVLVANLVSQLAGQVAATVISMRLLPALRFRPSEFRWETCKQVLGFTSWNVLGESANMIRRAADVPILKLFAGSIAVNDFYLGSMFDTQLRSLTIVAGQPLMPALTAMHAHDQKERLAAAFLRGGRIALWVSMAIAVPAIIFSHDLFALYLGSKYPAHVDAATVMAILLVGLPFSYPTMMFFRIAYARGQIRPLAIRGFLSQIGNLAMTLVLVGPLHMGAIGSAIASLTSFAIVEPLFNWPLALSTLQITWRRFATQTLAPGLLPALLSAIMGGLCLLFIADSSVWRVVVGIPLCMLAYGGGVIAALRPADKSDLLRVRRAIGV